MNRALERHNNREATVIPVILRDVDWKERSLCEVTSVTQGWPGCDLMAEQG